MMAAKSRKQSVFENIEESLRLLGKNEPLVEEAGVIRYVSGIPFALLNGLYSRGFQKVPLVQSHMSFLESRGLPFCCWLDADVDGSSLIDAGGVNPGVYTGLALDKEEFPEEVSFASGVTVEEVTSPELFAGWGQVIEEGYGWPLEISRPFVELNASFGSGTPLTHYLGYLDGRPVGTFSIIRSGDVGGLWNGIVRPEARRQGVATAMGLAALQRIKEMGCTSAAALLMAEKKASRLCENLGFQEVCHIVPYVFGSNPEDLEPDL